MPLNTSALSAPPNPTSALSSQGPRCTPCLDKAAAGWARCPDTEGWCGAHSSRLRHSQCCPRCPDEWRCDVDTALCLAAGFAADRRLNSGSLPLQKLGSPDTGPDKVHPPSSEIWRADYEVALSKTKSIVLREKSSECKNCLQNTGVKFKRETEEPGPPSGSNRLKAK